MFNTINRDVDFLLNELHVFYGNDNDNVTINCHYNDTWHQLLRSKCDSLEKTIKRLTKSPKTKHKKHQSNSSRVEDKQIPYCLQFEGEDVDCSTFTNNDWKSGMVLVLNKKEYHIVVNPPQVLMINTFPTRFVPIHCPIVCTAW
jgi:hypothetical protein